MIATSDMEQTVYDRLCSALNDLEKAESMGDECGWRRNQVQTLALSSTAMSLRTIRNLAVEVGDID